MRWIKLISVLMIVAAVFLLMQSLPVDRGMAALEGWLRGLGVWGPVVFAAIYVVATVLVLPGSVLTLAGGALFGLTAGTISVSLGSTVGAALAFLVGRYLARERVARHVRRYPRFEAVDRAIGEGGWRIVALLRLSPLVPFNLQNYLYGLTSIRFWPCVLTSWIAMLPATFMYVYFGHVARKGAEAAAGAAEASNPALTWGLRIVGLVATVAVTVYVTRIATRAVARRTTIAPPAPEPAGDATTSRGRGGVGLALVAVMLLAGAVWVRLHREDVARVIGRFLPPPAVMLVETYESNPGGPTFDHALFDRVLRSYVDQSGGVDYAGLGSAPEDLDAYIAAVASAPFDELGRDQKLALLINAYNAFTLRLILDHAPVASIRDIPAADRWQAVRWSVGGRTLSLNMIEHEEIRPRFREPRIHFALVCAAVGCPPLRAEAYAADRLDMQLDEQAARVHADGRWLRYDAGSGVLFLTPLYDWYGGDFEQIDGSVLAAASRYVPEAAAAIEGGSPPSIAWLDYDWGLNRQ